MQVKQSVKLRDVLWSYLTIILNAGINILILPAVLRYLPPNELGLWYVFVSFGAFVLIFEDSVNAILIRNVGYVCSGAKSIQKIGFDEISGESKPNLSLLKATIETVRQFFLILSAIVFFVFITLGTYYIKVIANEINFSYWMSAWLIYSFSVSLNLFFTYWRAVLLGMNLVSETNKSIMTAKIMQLLFTLLGLLMGYGLIAISVAYLLSGITARIMNIKYFNENISDEYNKNLKSYSHKDIFNSMSYNVSRFMLILIGNYMVCNSIIFLSSYYLGLNITAQYGLTVQLLTFSSAVGTTFYNASFPSINIARATKNIFIQKKLVASGMTILIITDIVFLIFLVLFGNKLLSLFTQQKILSTLPLIILGLAITLESITGCFTKYISTANYLPYVKSTVTSGIITIIVSFIYLIKFSNNVNYSIIVIILLRLVVQCAYNNWKWPCYALAELNIKPLDIFKISIFEFKIIIISKFKEWE